MQTRNFIVLMAVLSLSSPGDSSHMEIQHCCKLKTFISDQVWFKCPLADDGDNLASRFCQMKCVADRIGISNGTNLDFDKLDSLIVGLKTIGGQSSVDLHQKVAQFCKKVCDHQMKKNIQYEETSSCSAEFSYFVLCFALQLNDFCPDDSKIPSNGCKTQSSMLAGNSKQLKLLANN